MTTGVLLLHGSSGTPDRERVRILEAEGYDVLAPQWFDGRISEIGGQRMARGGTEEADRELGALAWADVRRVLAG